MTRFVRTSHRRVAVAAALVVASLAGPLEAQVTTGAIRGRIISTGGEPIGQAEVTARNVATGVTIRTVTDALGRYQFPALQVGEYAVQARRIGFQALERRALTVRLGETLVIDFTLNATAAVLDEIVVSAEAAPLIDPDQTATVALISSEQVASIPVNGRNFADLVALSPRVGVDIGDGTGGALSLGGGRRGANLIQIDGAGSTGTFFGGEARGSDRIPFAFSIESVQEFQVVTSGYDVEYGFFSGGVINAVTKSGTNEYHGSAFGYYRDDAITKNDFFGRSPEFSSRQLGATFSGPLIRDRLHFFVAVERQDRNEPVFGLPAPGSAPDPSTNVHPDSVARFLDILERVYGVTDRAGEFEQNQDEWAVFARIDWQINDKHRVTLRHNYTDLEQRGDRINPDETVGNGGVFNNTGNSTVAVLNSVFTPNLWNQFRMQLAFEPRPREANSLLPEGEVYVNSDFADGTVTSLRGLECCNDPVLPNNLEETTLEIVNNLNVNAGDHELKFGGAFNLFDYENFFFFQQQGRFRFGNLDDFENRIPFRFERALPNPGPDGQFFTDDDVLPLAEYKTTELSLYAQDTWHVTDGLALTGGVRADITMLPDQAPLNTQFQSDFGLRTDVAPEDANLSPRFAFTYDPGGGDGRTVFRGGVGVFFGRFPSVLYSNSLLNQGENQLSLRCDGAEVPTPDYRQYLTDPTSIPVACVGGGAASPPIPNVNVFDPAFEYPRNLKASIGFERAITGDIKVSADYLFSTTDHNFAVEDRNLFDPQFASAVENRPVFAPATGIASSGFAFGNRPQPGFNQALVHVSDAGARTHQLSIGIEQRGRRLSWQAGYTFTNSRDNASYSCCISSTALFETPTAGSPNVLGQRGDATTGTWGPSDFERPHSIVLSAIANLPAEVTVSGIWRTYSGRPWTPVIDGDANADGTFGNDRAFVGNTLTFEDPVTDAAVLAQHLARFDCLADQVGTIARRNSCRNALYTQLDLRIMRRFRTVGRQRFDVVVDLFNVLNLLNSDWSRNVGVSQFGSERELLVVEGFDAATRAYTYSVNPSFGQESDLTGFRTDQGTLQVGITYAF